MATQRRRSAHGHRGQAIRSLAGSLIACLLGVLLLHSPARAQLSNAQDGLIVVWLSDDKKSITILGHANQPGSPPFDVASTTITGNGRTIGACPSYWCMVKWDINSMLAAPSFNTIVLTWTNKDARLYATSLLVVRP